MSGGSFNYVCHSAADASEIFGKLRDVRDIEEWLRREGKHEAANEVLLYIKELETHRNRAETIGRRIENLLHAAEWTASCDTGIEAVDIAYWKLMGMEPPNAQVTDK